MRLKLYKLNFKSHLHIGTEFQEGTVEFPGSDTLFLAIASVIVETDGIDSLKEFFESSPIFSSTFPYYKNTFFLPKPIGIETFFADELKKKLKKAKWVEKDIVEKGNWEKVKPEGEYISCKKVESVYREVEILRNTKDRITESTTVFTVRAFKFSDEGGLYFLYSGDYRIDDSLKTLGEMGLGGGKSVGFGRFEVEPETFTWNSKGDFGLLVSRCIPRREEVQELRNARYMITSRGGWTENNRKKKLRTIAEGSILPCNVKGSLVKEIIEDRLIYRNYFALILPLEWWSK